MALDSDRLGNAMADAAIAAATPEPTTEDQATLRAFMKSVFSSTTVSEIVNNAVAAVTGVSGVTTGPGTSGASIGGSVS